jgi:hypothetical protein
MEIKKQLTTRYTMFGYECFLDDEQEPFHRGGNAKSCSETIHPPVESGEEKNIDMLPLSGVRSMAQKYHKELLATNSNWCDGGLYKGQDSQDEMLHMLDFGELASDTKRREKGRKASMRR